LKRIVLLLTVTTLSVLALAVPAFAQGQVERGPEHARSICSFSGLNDEVDEPAPEGGRVQSYGDYVKEGHYKPSEVKSGAPSPGTFCNPEKGPFEGPFEQHLP
jgi:hypothetical protein